MFLCSDGDDEFVLRETMVDVDDEGTLDEEEKLEEKEDHAAEISQLEEEGNILSQFMTIVYLATVTPPSYRYSYALWCQHHPFCCDDLLSVRVSDIFVTM